jgi:membrane protein implicated in regulation of membrane protease activity
METIILTLTKWHWFGIAAILGILEVMLGTSFFLLWLAISAITIAIILIGFPYLEWQYQFLIFALEAITCIFFWYVHLKNNPVKTDKPALNRRNEQYIDRVFTLAEPIINGRGKIQVDDSFWIIEGKDLPIGKKVRVIGVKGVILQVKEEL